MSSIKVILDKEDLLNLVKGTNGPCDYTSKFDNIGRLTGFPNEHWEWNNDLLKNLPEDLLYAIYLDLKAYKNKSTA